MVAKQQQQQSHSQNSFFLPRLKLKVAEKQVTLTMKGLCSKSKLDAAAAATATENVMTPENNDTSGRWVDPPSPQLVNRPIRTINYALWGVLLLVNYFECCVGSMVLKEGEMVRPTCFFYSY